MKSAKYWIVAGATAVVVSLFIKSPGPVLAMAFGIGFWVFVIYVARVCGVGKALKEGAKELVKGDGSEENLQKRYLRVEKTIAGEVEGLLKQVGVATDELVWTETDIGRKASKANQCWFRIRCKGGEILKIHVCDQHATGALWENPTEMATVHAEADSCSENGSENCESTPTVAPSNEDVPDFLNDMYSCEDLVYEEEDVCAENVDEAFAKKWITERESELRYDEINNSNSVFDIEDVDYEGNQTIWETVANLVVKMGLAKAAFISGGKLIAEH